MSSGSVGASPAFPPRPRTLVTFPTLYRLLLRTQITVPRLLGIGVLAALSVVIGLFARWDADPSQAAADAVSSYGFGILVPLATLWLGTSVVGDLIEDRLLVYLWLKPVPRWQLPTAAVLATVTVVLPLTAVPLAASALVAGAGDVALASLPAAALAVLAYAAVFVAAGFWFRRAVWWGLAFVLLWENLAAHVAKGTARFTVVGWASAVLAGAPDIDVRRDAGSVAAALIVLPLVAIGGWLAATWRYRRAEVD